MIVAIAHRSPRSARHAVEAAAKAEFDHLVARPWNQYEPDATLWWLVPSNDWPAYAYGEYAFNWAGDDRSALLARLHWEKGLDPKASSVYASAKGSRLIMQPDWHWHRLLKALASSQFASLPLTTRRRSCYVWPAVMWRTPPNLTRMRPC
jgi:hypothetical protein